MGGDKYFASGAGLADYALVTARPEGAPAGARGLALFLLPRLTRKGELNFKVHRLKAKLGTRAVPSGEVELEGSEAYLIGQKEEGIYYTLETLTVSRLANAVAAMGIAQKGFLEAFFRARRRESFGRRLLDHPLIRRDLVDLRVRQAGGLALAFHAVSAFDRAWEERPPYSPRYHLARFLSHLAKNRTAEHAQKSTALAMELFGGLGFLAWSRGFPGRAPGPPRRLPRRDMILNLLMETLYALPALLLALLFAAPLGPGVLSSMLAVGLSMVPAFYRVARAGTLSLRSTPFVEAALALGAPLQRILLHHLLPNLLSPLLVQASLAFAAALLAEAALSYLGLGVQPPEASLGRMLREAQSFLPLSPWPALVPGLTLSLAVLGSNLLGDGLRDQLDPRR